MNTVYESIYNDQDILNRLETEFHDYAVKPLGTFAGTIYKVLYRSNGSFVPADTSEQLIADGLKPFMPATRYYRHS
jgi:hypothetical protein